MTITALTQARTIIRQLTVQEKLFLLNDITAQLLHEATSPASTPQPTFPVFHIAAWPDDMPTNREELYNDSGR